MCASLLERLLASSRDFERHWTTTVAEALERSQQQRYGRRSWITVVPRRGRRSSGINQRSKGYNTLSIFCFINMGCWLRRNCCICVGWSGGRLVLFNKTQETLAFFHSALSICNPIETSERRVWRNLNLYWFPNVIGFCSPPDAHRACFDGLHQLRLSQQSAAADAAGELAAVLEETIGVFERSGE